MRLFLIRTGLYITSATPLFALAAPTNLAELIKLFTDLINPLIGLLTGIAVLLFIWGIVKYILYASDEKKKLSAKDTMVYGIVALFVLFSFWGIVQFLQGAVFG
jgi:hypothetical protein